MTMQLGVVGVGRRPVDGEPPVPWMDGWTPAHSEAALFLGECVAIGAVLGVVTELARPVWGRRQA